jgi:hypothetical protein
VIVGCDRREHLTDAVVLEQSTSVEVTVIRSPRKKLEISDSSGSAKLDLGVFESGKRIPFAIELVNKTAQDITIRDVGSSCGCVGAKVDSEDFSAGSTVVLELKVDFADGVFERAVHLSLLANGRVSPFQVVIRGTGSPRFVADRHMVRLKADADTVVVRFTPAFGDSLIGSTCSLKSERVELIDWRTEGEMGLAEFRGRADSPQNWDRISTWSEQLKISLASGVDEIISVTFGTLSEFTVMPSFLVLDRDGFDLMLHSRSGDDYPQALELRSNQVVIANGGLVKKSKTIGRYKLAMRDEFKPQSGVECEVYGQSHETAEWQRLSRILVDVPQVKN